MADVEAARKQLQSNTEHQWRSTINSNSWVSIALLSILSAVLLLTNLTTYPRPWIDEGYLLATARTLANEGLYTPVHDANVPEFDPTISTGPTLIVPVAMSYRLLGVGIGSARIVAVFAGFMALVAIGMLAYRLNGAKAALLMVLLVVAGTPDRYMSLIPMARQVLGEASAIGLCLYGIWLWIRACDLGGWVWWRFLIAGCSLGLALITKPQMVMAIPPACLLITLADRAYFRVAPWRAWIWTGIGMTLIVVGWFGLQASIIGSDTLLGYYVSSSSNLSAEVLNDSSRYLRRALGSLWRAGFAWWGIPGVLYGLAHARQRSREGLAHAWLLLIWGCWTFWMIGFSVGWSRYAFLSVLVPLFWTSRLLVDLFQRWSGIRRALLVILVAGGIGVNLYNTGLPIVTEQQQDAEQFGAFLRNTIPHDSTIYSWEWELEILAPHRFIYPSPSQWYDIVDLVQGNETIPDDFVDPAILTADYIIDGPFSGWTTVFRQSIDNYTTRIAQIGPYTLYEVNR